jgi:hypothetical protein
MASRSRFGICNYSERDKRQDIAEAAAILA